MTTKNENFEIGYLFIKSFVDPNNISRNLKWLVNDVIKEEFAVGDYNQAADGNVSHSGRIYVNEDDAKACITKVGSTSAYFTVQIPKESVVDTFEDSLNKNIQYFNVKEDTVPEVIGLSTSFGQYQITSQFECVNVAKETDRMDVSEGFDAKNVIKTSQDNAPIEIDSHTLKQNSPITVKQQPFTQDFPLHNLVRLR